MKIFFAVFLLSILAATTRSQTPEPVPVPEPTATKPASALSDEETAKVLEAITQVQKEFAKTKKEVLANALERYRSAEVSEDQALDFYLACYRVVKLERVPAITKEEQEERNSGEWKKKALASLGEGTTSAMLRMHLQLLVVLLESASAKSDAKIVSSLRTYMQAVAAYLPTAAATLEAPAGKRVVATVGKKSKREEEERASEKLVARKKSSAVRQMRQPVMGTLFAEAYSLGSYVEPPAQWPRSPTDFRAAYENVILPWYRANKKTDLPAVWDEYLKAETSLQEIAMQPAELLKWSATEYKSLYWSKWLDLLNNGVTATTATQELVKTIRENPAHPALKTWITDLAKIAGGIGGLKFDGVPVSPPDASDNPPAKP